MVSSEPGTEDCALRLNASPVRLETLYTDAPKWFTAMYQISNDSLRLLWRSGRGWVWPLLPPGDPCARSAPLECAERARIGLCKWWNFVPSILGPVRSEGHALEGRERLYPSIPASSGMRLRGASLRSLSAPHIAGVLAVRSRPRFMCVQGEGGCILLPPLQALV